MEILGSILIGAVVGGLATLVSKSKSNTLPTTLAVGILGALLGLATDSWLGSGGFTDFAMCEYVASGAGSVLALFVWLVAQRLFLDSPSNVARD